MPKLDWDDAEEIGTELCDKYRDTDPVAVSLTELRHLVTTLEGSDGNPAPPEEGLLEVIQRRWLEEYTALQE